ncbi:MAG: hypothetical protein ACTSW1_08280 [Candidatus Hodarchaeales archaeon]
MKCFDINKSLTFFGNTYDASSGTPEKAFQGKKNRYWQTFGEDTDGDEVYLECDFGINTAFNYFFIKGSNIADLGLVRWDGSKFIPLTTGSDILGGDFGDGTGTEGVGWTDNGDGTASCDGSQVSNSDLVYSGPYTFESGVSYALALTVSGRTAGGVTPNFDGNWLGKQSGNGDFLIFFTGTGSPNNILFRADSNFDGDVSLVSVKRSVMNDAISSDDGMNHLIDVTGFNYEKYRITGSDTIVANEEKIITEVYTFDLLGTFEIGPRVKARRRKGQQVMEMDNYLNSIINRGIRYEFEYKLLTNKQNDVDLFAEMTTRDTDFYIWMNDDEEIVYEVAQAPFEFGDIFRVSNVGGDVPGYLKDNRFSAATNKAKFSEVE